MRMKQKIDHIILLLAVLLSFSSCVVENAKIAPKQTVTIFTDCLSKKDVKLFEDFHKKEKIKVKIIYLPTDTLLKKIKQQGLNTSADLLILKSLFDINKARLQELLHPIKTSKMDEQIDVKFKSKDNSWFGIGFDPYVFIAKNDTLPSLSDFNELLDKENQQKWSTNYTLARELIPMLAAVLHKKKRVEIKEWYANFLDKKHTQDKNYNSRKIALVPTNTLLTSYSEYVKIMEDKKTKTKDLSMVFSNQKGKGAFYNLHCAAIVYQAKNYENAKLLLEYIASDRMNDKLNNRWNTFPINIFNEQHRYAYQNNNFKLFKGSSAKLIVNYVKLERYIKDKNTE